MTTEARGWTDALNRPLEAEKGKETCSHSERPEGASPAHTLTLADFRPLISRTVGELMNVVFIQWVCGHLFQQP